MVPGCKGVTLTLTAKVLVVLLIPQLLTDNTETFPPVFPVVTVILVLVELPDQPDGKVHT